MWRRVRAEEEFVRLIAGNGGNQCLTVGFAFEYGQAEMMRAHAADQKVVAVEQQVGCGVTDAATLSPAPIPVGRPRQW